MVNFHQSSRKGVLVRSSLDFKLVAFASSSLYECCNTRLAFALQILNGWCDNYRAEKLRDKACVYHGTHTSKRTYLWREDAWLRI